MRRKKREEEEGELGGGVGAIKCLVDLKINQQSSSSVCTHLTWRLEQISIPERGAKAKYVITFRMFGNWLHNCAINDD